ncbi:MAG: RHS repeat protein [Planctomycetes bacterium]|nr:RHS repeat protein [Planctomycetota bacterium]
MQIEPLEERRVLAATISWVSSPPSVQEGDLDGAGQREESFLTFTFQLTGQLDDWSYVDWGTVDDGAPAGATSGSDPSDPGSDYFQMTDNDQVWFEPGTSWAPVTVQVPVWGDLDPELNETFRLVVSSGDSENITNYYGTEQTGTIIDNDNLYDSPDIGCHGGGDALLTGDNIVGAGDGSSTGPGCGCGGGAPGAAGAGGAPGPGNIGAPLPGGMGPSYSAMLNPHPIITLDTDFFPAETTLPTSFEVKLRLYSDPVNYVQTGTKTYDATGLQLTDPLRFAVQVDATGFSTGRHRWEMDVTRFYSGVEGATSTHAGQHMLVSRLGSPYGDGRWLDGLDALYVSHPDGVALVHSTGRAYWFERDANGNLVNTENAIESLVQNVDGSYTLTYKDGNVAEFSSTGALLVRRDPNGNETEFEHTGGLLTTVRDAVSGRETTFSYPSGKLSTSTDFAGHVVDFGFTGDKLTSIMWPAPEAGASRPTVTFAYASSGVEQGLLTQVVDERGNQTSFSYDTFRRLASVTRPTPDGAGTYTTLLSSLQSEAAASTDPLGTEERQGSYTDEFGREFTFETDKRGQITYWASPPTDPLQNIIEIERCGCGRIESILQSDPDSPGGPRQDELTKYAYTDTNFPGSPTEIRYVVGVVDDPLNGETDDIVHRFEYGTNGQVAKYTDPENRVTSYTLDAAGNVLAET